MSCLLSLTPQLPGMAPRLRSSTTRAANVDAPISSLTPEMLAIALDLAARDKYGRIEGVYIGEFGSLENSGRVHLWRTLAPPRLVSRSFYAAASSLMAGDLVLLSTKAAREYLKQVKTTGEGKMASRVVYRIDKWKNADETFATVLDSCPELVSLDLRLEWQILMTEKMWEAMSSKQHLRELIFFCLSDVTGTQMAGLLESCAHLERLNLRTRFSISPDEWALQGQHQRTWHTHFESKSSLSTQDRTIIGRRR